MFSHILASTDLSFWERIYNFLSYLSVSFFLLLGQNAQGRKIRKKCLFGSMILNILFLVLWSYFWKAEHHGSRNCGREMSTCDGFSKEIDKKGSTLYIHQHQVPNDQLHELHLSSQYLIIVVLFKIHQWMNDGTDQTLKMQTLLKE